MFRDAVRRHAGHEVDTQGDAFFVVFENARDAIAAASEAQTALAKTAWLGDATLRVRMGIHSGRPSVVGDGYVGMDVHVGSRICSAGHGGQVLVSEESAAALAGGGYRLRDLGDHRLKDLAGAQHLYQLEIDGLDGDFPRLRAVGPSNLPAELSELIGRTREVFEIRDLLKRGVRQLTLTGPGGTGKTRLAIAAARALLDEDRFPAGAFFVPLAPLSDPALIPSALAKELGVIGGAGQPLLEAVKAFVAPRRLLLVLDNYEHLLSGASVVAELLAAGPDVGVILTSRAPLRITGEQLYPVAPLDPPNAVALFVARAEAVDPAFALTPANADELDEICARLDGLPLALELAASRVNVMPPRSMIERLDRRLDLLSSGARDAPGRQRTVRATLQWSCDLLAPEERELFARLGVFAGGFTDEAATEVASSPPIAGFDEMSTLGGLVDGNLSHRVASDAVARFSLLETIRDFALELLASSGLEDDVRLQHARYFASLAERARPFLRSRDQDAWLDLLEREHDNLRAALAFAIERHPELGVRLAGSLSWFWDVRGHLDEGRDWLRRALQRGEDAKVPIDPWLTFGLARISIEQGDFDGVEPLLERSIELFEAAGETDGLVIALTHLGWAAEPRGDLARSLELHRRAYELARSGGSDWALSVASHNLGGTLWITDDREAGRRLAEDSLPLRRRVGDRYGLTFTLNTLGGMALEDGDPARALPPLEEALSIARGIGSLTMVAFVSGNLGFAYLLLDREDDAARAFEESTQLVRDMSIKGIAAENLNGIAAIVAKRGEPERAARLSGAAKAMHALAGAPVLAYEEAAVRSMDRARDALGS